MSGITALLSTALADRYRIEKRRGEVDMAAFYLARDPKRDHKVRAMLLGPELARTPGGGL
ncbi:MAG: hypothetical protein JSU98_16350 [Gemmatimonadales bacterium]|nr:MAG: hypothetical protein JSU98_16350 [Gemmatimonadales bacterium]